MCSGEARNVVGDLSWEGLLWNVGKGIGVTKRAEVGRRIVTDDDKIEINVADRSTQSCDCFA